MVAIDAEGRPTPVPRLRLADDADRAAWERAEAIRLAALDRRERERAARR
jgi:acyl-CoA hydrolase